MTATSYPGRVRFASDPELRRMGREWAHLAIRHNTEPTTTGNLAHDRACAEEFLKQTGRAPSWYSADRFGVIFHGQPWHHYKPGCC